MLKFNDFLYRWVLFPTNPIKNKLDIELDNYIDERVLGKYKKQKRLYE